MSDAPKKILGSMEEIRRHFAESDIPYYFISATNFNLMGMHVWVRGWQNINLVDCFDGGHPRVLMVADDHSRVFESIEDINLYLINSPQASALFAAHGDRREASGRAIFLFFNEQIETVCQTLNLEIILPRNLLVREIDSKIVTTEIGNLAGVASVPNVLARVGSFADLQLLAMNAGLGERWVVQTAYGDSGKTTFFIASEADYRPVAAKIESEAAVKVMRWINCTGTAIEACATRWGTFVGPLLTELIGIDALTPYRGGWCGNELYESAFSSDIRRQVQKKTQAIGDELYQRGYRGYFELDYLIDQDTNEVHLGELNARITGITAMTNMSDFSTDHIPLFLFHLLEYQRDVHLTIDANDFNQQVLASGAAGTASQVILKYTEDMLKIITEASVSGVYALNSEGRLDLKQAGYSRRDALAEDEVYVMRVMAAGEYAYKGGDLAIMFLNCVVRGSQGQLNPLGERWVSALRSSFQFRHLTQEERSLVELARNPAGVKSGGGS